MMSSNGTKPAELIDGIELPVGDVEPIKPGEEPFSWGSLTERKARTLKINGHEVRILPLTYEEAVRIKLQSGFGTPQFDEKKMKRLIWQQAVVSPALTPAELAQLDKLPVDIVNAVSDAAVTSARIETVESLGEI